MEKNIHEGLLEYQATPGALLIDLREQEDYKNSHIPGAINIPVSSLREEIRKVATFRTPIFLYCYNGKRSAEAAELLKTRGYEQAIDVGGIVFYTGETTAPTMTIRELREKHQLKQAEFAQKVGLSTVTISAYESGRQKITPASVKKIQQVYHVQIVDPQPEQEEDLPSEPLVKAPGMGRKKKKYASVKDLRRAFRLSQKAFGDLIGISGTAVGHYETGRSAPSQRMLNRIRAAFGVELELANAPAKPGRKPRINQDAKPEDRAKPEKAAKPEDNAKPEKAAKPGKKAKPEKAAEPEKAAKPETPEKPKRTRKAGKPAKARSGGIPRVVLQDGDWSMTLEEILEKAQNPDSICIHWDEGKVTWVRGDDTGTFDL